MKFLFTFLLLFISSFIFSQSFQYTFDRSKDDAFYTVAAFSEELTDSILELKTSFDCAGYSYNSNGVDKDVLLVRMNLLGDVLSKRIISSPFNEQIINSCKTLDGGAVFVGNTNQNGKDQIFILKVDRKNNILWYKSYASGLDDYGASIKSTRDGGYIVSGTATSSSASNGAAIIFKVDKNGILLWSNVLKSSSYDSYNDVIEMDNGSIIAMGTTFNGNNGGTNFLLSKFDKAGKANKHLSFGTSANEAIYTGTKFDSNSFILAGGGGRNSGSTGLDGVLIFIDSNLTVNSSKYLITPYEERIFHIENDRIEGITIGGYLFNGTSKDLWVAKIDQRGNILASTIVGVPLLMDLKKIIKTI